MQTVYTQMTLLTENNMIVVSQSTKVGKTRFLASFENPGIFQQYLSTYRIARLTVPCPSHKKL